MRKFLTNIIIMFGLISCSSDVEDVNYHVPITGEDSLHFNIGDVVSFKIDSSKYSSGFVDEITKDEGGIWYKIIFTDIQTNKLPELHQLISSKVFGRKILSGIDERGFVYGLDGEFISDSCVIRNQNQFEVIGKISPNKNLYMGGSYGASSEYKNFIDQYLQGIERRKLPPEDYKDFLKSKRTEEYVYIKDFLIK